MKERQGLTGAVVELTEFALDESLNKGAGMIVEQTTKIFAQELAKIPKTDFDGRLSLLIGEKIATYPIKIVPGLVNFSFGVFVKGQSAKKALADTTVSIGLDKVLISALGGAYFPICITSKAANLLHKNFKSSHEEMASHLRSSVEQHIKKGNPLQLQMALEVQESHLRGWCLLQCFSLFDKAKTWVINSISDHMVNVDNRRVSTNLPIKHNTNVAPETKEERQEVALQVFGEHCFKNTQFVLNHLVTGPIIQPPPSAFQVILSKIKFSVSVSKFSTPIPHDNIIMIKSRIQGMFQILDKQYSLCEKQVNSNKHPNLDKLHFHTENFMGFLTSEGVENTGCSMLTPPGLWKFVKLNTGYLDSIPKLNVNMEKYGPGLLHITRMWNQRRDDLNARLLQKLRRTEIKFDNPVEALQYGERYYLVKEYAAARGCIAPVLDNVYGNYKMLACYLLAYCYFDAKEYEHAYFYYKMSLEECRDFPSLVQQRNNQNAVASILHNAFKYLKNINNEPSKWLGKRNSEQVYYEDFVPALQLIISASLLNEYTAAQYLFKDILKMVDKAEAVITRAAKKEQKERFCEEVVHVYLEFKKLLQNITSSEGKTKIVQQGVRKIISVLEQHLLPPLRQRIDPITLEQQLVFARWTAGELQVKDFGAIYKNQFKVLTSDIYWDGEEFRKINYSNERIVIDNITKQSYSVNISGQDFIVTDLETQENTMSFRNPIYGRGGKGHSYTLICHNNILVIKADYWPNTIGISTYVIAVNLEAKKQILDLFVEAPRKTGPSKNISRISIYKCWLFVNYGERAWYDDNLRIYNLNDGKLLKTIRPNVSTVMLASTHRISFLSYGDKLFFHNCNNSIYVYDMQELKLRSQVSFGGLQFPRSPAIVKFIYADDEKVVYSVHQGPYWKRKHFTRIDIWNYKQQKLLFSINSASIVDVSSTNGPCFNLVIGGSFIKHCIMYKSNPNLSGKNEHENYNLFDIDSLRVLPKPKEFNRLWRATSFVAVSNMIVGKEKDKFKVWDMRKMKLVGEFRCDAGFRRDEEKEAVRTGRLIRRKSPRSIEFEILELSSPSLQLYPISHIPLPAKAVSKLPSYKEIFNNDSTNKGYAEQLFIWAKNNPTTTIVGATVGAAVTGAAVHYLYNKFTN